MGIEAAIVALVTLPTVAGASSDAHLACWLVAVALGLPALSYVLARGRGLTLRILSGSGSSQNEAPSNSGLNPVVSLPLEMPPAPPQSSSRRSLARGPSSGAAGAVIRPKIRKSSSASTGVGDAGGLVNINASDDDSNVSDDDSGTYLSHMLSDDAACEELPTRGRSRSSVV